MIFAAIDIGSNAVRLLFANAFEKDEQIHVEKATLIRIPIRLGKDVYKGNSISKKRAGNLIKTLKAFSLLIDVYKPVAFEACATAAMREAENGQEILKRIRKETGMNIRIVDGLEEAEIIRSANGFTSTPGNHLTMFVDLGGGSTEISLMWGSKVIGARSFNIGTLRLTGKKVPKSEWDALESWLKEFSGEFGKMNVIGSGGNINKIAKLYGNTEDNTLTFQQLEYAFKHLSSYSLQERIELMGLRPDRADVIVPAAKVFLFITRIIKAEEILVPKIGLADGLIYRLYQTHGKKPKRSVK
ncbi:MAG: Ppx/GppA family phosphatase [Bacteroidales bacterium]